MIEVIDLFFLGIDNFSKFGCTIALKNKTAQPKEMHLKIF